MVKEDCPRYKPNLAWDSGIKLGDYYYLLNQLKNQIIKVELSTDDGVLFGRNFDNSYVFLDDDFNEVDGSYSIMDTVDIAPIAGGGHQMSKTDYNLIVTSYHEIVEPEPVGVQLIDKDLNILNSYDWHHCDGVAWSGDKIFILIDWLIFIFNNNLELIDTAGILSHDDSNCIYKDGYLWTGELHYRELRKRDVNDVHVVPVTVNMPGGIKGVFDWYDYVLIQSHVLSSIENHYFTKINPINGRILAEKYYKSNSVENVITFEDTFVFLDKSYNMLVKKDSSLETLISKNTNLEAICKIE